MNKIYTLILSGCAAWTFSAVAADIDWSKLPPASTKTDVTFTNDILPLEDAPKRFTKQVHLRLHTAHVKPEQLDSVRELVAAHPGKCPLLLCFMRPGGEVVFVDTNERFNVTPSLKLQQEADARFGEDTYYAKVDASLPERQRRSWEKKTGNGGEE